MNKIVKVLLISLMIASMPIKHWAQTPYRQYADDGILLNFHEIDNVDFRVFLLYNLSQDNQFDIIADDEPGLFIINSNKDRNDTGFFEDFESFYQNTYSDFSMLSKMDIYDLATTWKSNVTPSYFASIMMDIALRHTRVDNDHCADSNPFCTSDEIQFQAATTSQTADQLESETFDDGCIGSSYNPSWYHMRIHDPGQFIIHMEGVDPDNSSTQRDIDFCMWGPFTDPIAPCVSQLTTNKIIDCCYSSHYTEDVYLGYAADNHVHNTSHGTVNYHLPESGEYYILMITNFSRQPCVISFTKTEGSGPGTTDCDILPGIANNDGPYCVGDVIHLSVNSQAGASYSWTGPDGFSSNQQNPTINNCTYAQGGTYTCTTTVGGNSTSGSTTVIVYPQPIADFTATEVCLGSSTEFTSTSTTNPPSEQSLFRYHWDFGDGTTGSGEQVSHTYAQAGTYTVTHSLQTSGSCNDEVTKTVNIYAMPVPVATAEPYSVQYAEAATITVNPGAEGSFTYHWEPANMVLDPDSQTTQTVPLIESQVYTVTVTNTQGGCTSTTSVTVSMDGSNLTATATADQYEICEGSSTTLHALPVAGTGNYTFSWTPANTLSDPSGRNPVASPAVGTTTYSCHVSDGIISQDVDVTIMVHPNEASEMHRAICEGTSYSFFGQNLNTEGVYRHTLQTQYGCDSIVTLYLGINNIQESQFTVPEEESCDSYYWDPRGHQIVQTDHNDMTYTQSGTYHRTYKDIADCDSIVTMNVQFEYTPHPTPIYPMDPSNETPHWVVTATEFQINTYDFQLWDTNPLCYWDTVTWSCEGAPDWIVEPFGPKSKNCKLYVLDIVPDTIWLTARAFNRCAPDDGVEQKYWLVCSFYGIGEQSSNLADFSVVPNPNNGLMTLNFEHLTGKVNIKVYNMQGALIDSFETYNGGDSLSYTYAMKDKADGIYFFVASGREGTKAKKVIIQH